MLGSSQEAVAQTPSLLELPGEHKGTPHRLLVVVPVFLQSGGTLGVLVQVWVIGNFATQMTFSASTVASRATLSF